MELKAILKRWNPGMTQKFEFPAKMCCCIRSSWDLNKEAQCTPNITVPVRTDAGSLLSQRILVSIKDPQINLKQLESSIRQLHKCRDLIWSQVRFIRASTFNCSFPFLCTFINGKLSSQKLKQSSVSSSDFSSWEEEKEDVIQHYDRKPRMLSLQVHIKHVGIFQSFQ